jgi:hypothetical protein
MQINDITGAIIKTAIHRIANNYVEEVSVPAAQSIPR